MNTFDLASFDVAKFDSILSNGLSSGLGKRGEMVCIEAAICETLGLPHGDNPECVADSVKKFKIRLNDSRWSSPRARAEGLRNLGLAQLGSKGVVDDKEFASRIAVAATNTLLPKFIRQTVLPDGELLKLITKCELAQSLSAAIDAVDEHSLQYSLTYGIAAIYSVRSALVAAMAAQHDNDNYIYASSAVVKVVDTIIGFIGDEFRILLAQLALEILKDMGSPGVQLIK